MHQCNHTRHFPTRLRDNLRGLSSVPEKFWPSPQLIARASTARVILEFTRQMRSMSRAETLVAFYRFWHGRLHLKGAGYLIGKLAPTTKSLQRYQLQLPEGHYIELDFRDISGACWLNRSLGDDFEETGLLKAISTFIQPETVVWDVGANCGIVSYMLAKSNPGSRIVFFEPIKAIFSLACSALAPFAKISGFNVALSDKPGNAELTIPHRNSTTATLNPESTERFGHKVNIQCKTGDEMIAEAGAATPDVIKIDTEGHEAEVMTGLQETIRKNHPVIFFEHISLSDEQVMNMIPESYEIFSVGSNDGTLQKGFDRRRGHNSVLIPRSARLAT
jgi:FkbM family methyltransferase